jgi:hypothetical protein
MAIIVGRASANKVNISPLLRKDMNRIKQGLMIFMNPELITNDQIVLW